MGSRACKLQLLRPVHLDPVPCNEKPVCCGRAAPLTTARERLSTEPGPRPAKKQSKAKKALIKKKRVCFSHGFCSLTAQSLSHAQRFVTPWTTARQASLFFTISRSLLKFMSIESGMPSSHLILCHLLLLLPSVFPTIRVFSSELALCIRWPQYWSFSFNISPSNEYSGFISSRTDWFDLVSKGLSRVFSSTTV